jgi:hypothetical protein
VKRCDGAGGGPRPPQLAPLEPKSSASTNSATPARGGLGGDLNPQPDRYERPALTIELQAQGILIPGLCQDENGADDGSRTRTGKPEGF